MAQAVRSEVLAAANRKFSVFCDVTPYSLMFTEVKKNASPPSLG
jgi:hypothetical protein